ncbi:hypothetical protein ACF08W_32015 [Streptomyces sp. NPDC015144]|uniref:hypothetical protein n=1 Tax=Streptomyces sp. NPDC015144 TaxID=3364944 RepID=UPI0037025990
MSTTPPRSDWWNRDSSAASAQSNTAHCGFVITRAASHRSSSRGCAARHMTFVMGSDDSSH